MVTRHSFAAGSVSEHNCPTFHPFLWNAIFKIYKQNPVECSSLSNPFALTEIKVQLMVSSMYLFPVK
jgi:hypothetical protein